MIDEPEGYRIDLFTSLTEPLLFGGVPRAFGIMNIVVAGIFTISLHLPWFGIPVGMTVHAVAAYLTRRDPHFFGVLRDHLRLPSYWD